MQDPAMILSTGKDARTILWDVNGAQLGEFSTPSFNFDVQWSPTNAGVFATSSYGGGDGQDGTVTPRPSPPPPLNTPPPITTPGALIDLSSLKKKKKLW
jgi:hypothetical protein